MTTSGLASSLPAVRKHEARADQSAPPHPAQMFQPPKRTTFRRGYGRALAVSVGFHLLLLLASPYLVLIDVSGGGGDSAAPASGPAGGGAEQVSYMDIGLSPPSTILPLSEIAASGPAVTGMVQSGGIVVAPSPGGGPAVQGASGGAGGAGTYPTAGAAGAGTGAGAAGGAGAGSGTGSADAAGILRPGYRDPRLYVEPPLLPDLEKSPQQVYAEHLSSRIAAVRDSMAADDARNRTTSDWVRTDGSGNRWGLSSEGLHLGGITIPRALIPSPRSTGDNATQQDARERQRQRDEIQRQEQDRARRTVQEERARSMREADAARRNDGGN